MPGPLFSINSGAISGAVWTGKYGYQPNVKKAKRSKEGKFEKDENGKQVYSDFYNKNDMLNLSFVAGELYSWLVNNPEPKKEDENIPF